MLFYWNCGLNWRKQNGNVGRQTMRHLYVTIIIWIYVSILYKDRNGIVWVQCDPSVVEAFSLITVIDGVDADRWDDRELIIPLTLLQLFVLFLIWLGSWIINELIAINYSFLFFFLYLFVSITTNLSSYRFKLILNEFYHRWFFWKENSIKKKKISILKISLNWEFIYVLNKRINCIHIL